MTNFTPGAALLGGGLIGLAAVMLMLTVGRIAGISGFVSRLLPPYGDGFTVPRFAFVAGLIASPFVYSAISGSSVAFDVTSNIPLLLGAGFLVGLGAVMGGGCTSGHGVCGTARISARSLVATPVFLVTAMITVFVVRHVIGG